MWKKGSVSILFLIGMISLTQLINSEADAVVTMPRCAIIVVSNLTGYNDIELEKADQFYQYLKDEGYTDDDIVYLTEVSSSGYDGDPNITNIQESFSWLQNTSSSSSQPAIYISDHVKWTCGNITFQFIGGNVSAITIDSWLDRTEYQELTLILNGNRSALAGTNLSGQDRDIICSMRSTQTFEEDLFNITRSLKDNSADLNFDGEVSYIEAYWKEKLNLLFYIQDPQLYGG